MAAPPRALLVTCMRDEGPFLLEWLAHHKAIGFTDFLIYANDCRDGTDKMLRHLEKMGEIRYFKNSRRGKKTVQWQALDHAARQPEMQQVDWIFSADADEFLVIRPGAGQLSDLFAACPEATGFALTWRMFGSGGHKAFVAGSVIGNFKSCAPDTIVWPWQAIQFKCLYRNDGAYDKLGIHRPKTSNPKTEENTVWRDGSGNPLPWPAPQGMTMIPTVSDKYALAQINHYALGSAENFLVKSDRGRANHTSGSIDRIYWRDRNLNSSRCDAIDIVRPIRQKILAGYLDDPKLKRLHQKAIDWRRERIAEILDTAEGKQFYDDIVALPDTPIYPLPLQQNYMQKLIEIRAELRAEKQRSKQANKNV